MFRGMLVGRGLVFLSGFWCFGWVLTIFGDFDDFGILGVFE